MSELLRKPKTRGGKVIRAAGFTVASVSTVFACGVGGGMMLENALDKFNCANSLRSHTCVEDEVPTEVVIKLIGGVLTGEILGVSLFAAAGPADVRLERRAHVKTFRSLLDAIEEYDFNTSPPSHYEEETNQ